VDSPLLTISKLKRWSINYYIDTANTAERASADRQRANGGLGEYYSEHETRTPVWLCAGDARAAAALVGLSDVRRAGGEADAAVVARWLDDGVAPNAHYIEFAVGGFCPDQLHRVVDTEGGCSRGVIGAIELAVRQRHNGHGSFGMESGDDISDLEQFFLACGGRVRSDIHLLAVVPRLR